MFLVVVGMFMWRSRESLLQLFRRPSLKPA
jgi:hypothetical protein